MMRLFWLVTFAATASCMNVHDCGDLEAWKETEQKGWVMLTSKKGCEWIAEAPQKRCGLLGNMRASEACRTTCKTGGVDQLSFQVLPEKAQRQGMAGVGAISAQPLLFDTLSTTLNALRKQSPRDCAWVGEEDGKYAETRCKEMGSIPAVDACHDHCYLVKTGALAREGRHTRKDAQKMALRGSARA
jgi:hypothetical protein